MTPQHRRARTAYLWVGVIVPLVIFALTTIVLIVWLPQMPDPVAIHWSSGGPDGFGPPWVNIAVPVGLGVALTLIFAAMAWGAGRLPAHREGPATLLPRSQDPGIAARFLGATSLGLAVMMSFIALLTAGVQRGLDDARQAPDITWATFLGFALLAGFAILGWFLQPAPPLPSPRTGPGAAPLPLADGGRAAWFGVATLSRAAIITLATLCFVLLALGVAFLALSAIAGWFALGAALLMIVMLFLTSVFRVRADSAGLHVRSMFGWPRYEVPAAEIASVRAVAVQPFGEFGGWGIRWGLDGRFGIVLRTGEGIEVTRTNGKIMVVTVDDATTCAAVLSTAASARKDDA